jgi:hypothetical protein
MTTYKECLSVLVAEKVMGWKLYNYEEHRDADSEEDYEDAYTTDEYGWDGRGSDKAAYDWSPESDANQAIEVLKKIAEADRDIAVEFTRCGTIVEVVIGWIEDDCWSRSVTATASSFAEAACMAALAVVDY